MATIATVKHKNQLFFLSDFIFTALHEILFSSNFFLAFSSIACMLLILEWYVPELAGPSSSHNVQKYWHSLHMSEQHPLDSKCFVSHIIVKEPMSYDYTTLIKMTLKHFNCSGYIYAMATDLFNAIKCSSHIVPYGRHGWNSLPIMSLQGQRRRREHAMHAYSASRLCSSVIDRCGWGNSRLSCAWRWNNSSSSVTLLLTYLSCSESPQLRFPPCT